VLLMMVERPGRILLNKISIKIILLNPRHMAMVNAVPFRQQRETYFLLVGKIAENSYSRQIRELF